MERTYYEVSPNGDRWEVRKGKSVIKDFDKQDEAESFARETARNDEPSELRIKGQDGSYRDEATYGDDPAKYPS